MRSILKIGFANSNISRNTVQEITKLVKVLTVVISVTTIFATNAQELISTS
jgi:hypothetical protein